jgi:hypothetical protein
MSRILCQPLNNNSLAFLDLLGYLHALTTMADDEIAALVGDHPTRPVALVLTLPTGY